VVNGGGSEMKGVMCKGRRERVCFDMAFCCVVTLSHCHPALAYSCSTFVLR